MLFRKNHSSRPIVRPGVPATKERARADGSAVCPNLFKLVCTVLKTEFLLVLDLSQITCLLDAVIFPLVGSIALMYAKLSRGVPARRAEKQFFAILVVLTVVTLRTVITCDEIWIVHTMSLGGLIVCSLLILGQVETPDQDPSVAV